MKATPIILVLLVHFAACTSSPSRREVDPVKSKTLIFSRLRSGPQSTQEREVSADLFPVVVDGKYGFINRGGNLVIPPQFDDASGFSEGLAAVKIDSKWGFIDEQGTIVVQPRFIAYNLAYKEPSATTFPNYTEWIGLYFSEGLAVAQEEWGKPVGFIDKSGTYVIPARFQIAHAFRGGEAAVFLKGNWFTIDKTGEVLFRVNHYDLSWPLADGLRLVGKESWGEWDDIEHDVKVTLPSGGPYGYVDDAGRQVINFMFESARNFSEGLAAVRVGTKWGYINKKGKQVIQPMYDLATEFHAGVAAVKVGNAIGYVDKSGRYIWEPKE